VVPLLAHLSWGLRLPRQVHGDELWTLSEVLSKSWDQMFEMVLKRDNHPPLYYYIAKCWMALTHGGIPQLRWLSYLFSVLTICALAWLYRSHRQNEKIFALGLLGTNPLLTYYSATVRPYSLVVLLAAVMTISAFRLKRQKTDGLLSSHNEELGVATHNWRQGGNARRSWSLLYYGSALLLALTHYFGTLYVWVAFVGDLITRRIETKPWKGALLLGLTALWPVAQILFGSVDEQSKSNAWIRVVFLISTVNNFLAGTFPLLMISKSIPQYTFGVVLALLLLCITLRPLATSYWNRLSCQPWSLSSLLAADEVFWLLVCAGVVAVGCLADLLLPFTTPYYFLVCLPAVAILLAKLCSASIRDRFTGTLSFLTILSIAILQISLSQQRLALP
jgi:uncharacterized membrane protein